jgi:hypothetical protein
LPLSPLEEEEAGGEEGGGRRRSASLPRGGCNNFHERSSVTRSNNFRIFQGWQCNKQKRKECFIVHEHESCDVQAT